FASTTASLAVYAGYVSVNACCSCWSESGWSCIRLLGVSRLEGATPGLWPALDDHLGLGEELEAVMALRVQVTEEAVAPTREREERHGGSDAEVDADVACQRLMPEVPGRGARRGEDRGLVAEATVVDHGDGLVEARGVHQRQHGPEDLGGADGAARIDAVKDGRVHEVAVAEAIDFLLAAVDQQARSLADALFDEAVDALARRRVDDGTHLGVLVEAVADTAAGRGRG